jgi:predicted acyltransferase
MTDPVPAPTPIKRLLSLDILRGVTIAFMIMVNNNGGISNGSGGSTSWWFMNHADWIGLTPTDLVFPTFLFVIGISVVFAFEARLAKGATRSELVRHTLSRTFILILFGIIVNNFPFFGFDHGHIELPIAHMRFFGVLQRLAVGYCFVALFYLWDKRISTKIIAAALCLLAYWGIIALVPTPGHGVQFLNPDFNIVNWVDQQLMPGHLYEDWTTHNLRDPEGFLSTLPSLATALLGLITGIFLRTTRSAVRSARGLVLGSIGCLITGYVWSIWFPLSKKMWTSSFTLVAAGYSLALFALVYWMVEIMNWRKVWGWPWLVFGSNAIVAYMFSELFSGIVEFFPHPMWHGRPTSLLGWLNMYYYTIVPDPGWAAFTYCLTILAICFIPVVILYKKKIFVKI